MVALVHEQTWSGNAPLPITPSPAPTPGNLMVLSVVTRNTGLGPSAISGWTLASPGVQSVGGAGKVRDHALFYRFAQAGDTSWSPAASGSTFSYSEWSGVGAFMGSVGSIVAITLSIVCGGPITTTGPALIIGGEAAACPGGTQTYSGAPTAPTVELDDCAGGLGGPGYWSGYRIEAAAGTFTIAGTATLNGGFFPDHAGITVAFELETPPVADFVADQFDGTLPLTVQFTDTSTGGPTSWAWDFGDGGTSTSQHPSHVYSVAGTYTVSLTATNADGSDSETKTAYISVGVDVGYETPEPGLALIEIYAAAPGSAKWDIAKWDEAVWSEAEWQDVTPQSVDGTVMWGSRRPEDGILSQPSAGSWGISTYDPERLLDPANADGPWVTDLIPGLPIRVTHRGVVIRRGLVESIAHAFAEDAGMIRATDNQAPLSQADVPPDVTLSDTLYARAIDAIAAAGLAVEVLPVPPSGDPALVAWVTGEERTAWQWIADAALQVLHIPYIDRLGRLGFRAWASPLLRGRAIESPELIDLTDISSYSGLFSQIQVMDDTGPPGAIVERALTPPPRYGRRTYLRNDPTPDASDWANAVLEDRALPGLRWIPGDVFPLSANSVERFATIEAIEQISLAFAEAVPPILVGGIVVGGEFRLIAKRGRSADWRFRFNVAQSPLPPLLADDEDPPLFLLAESGDEYLYPDA